MKNIRLEHKRLSLLFLLLGMSVTAQPARACGAISAQISLLSDTAKFPLDQRSEVPYQQLVLKGAQGIDIDLTDTDSKSEKTSAKSRFPKSSKVLILGGTTALPM